MTGYFCNPVNITYRYQFNRDPRQEGLQIDREAADPSMICFRGVYYMFISMNLDVWVSEDMTHWTPHRLPENLPLYDYAPDARVIGEYVYFCASKRGEICNYYRTKDILNGPYEEISGTFDFWDPNLFCDDDGRIYFYWGCANTTPIWGVELDPATMKPLGERRELLIGDPFARGYERMGEDNCDFPRSEEQVRQMYLGFLKSRGMTEEQVPPNYAPMIQGMFTKQPFIEGAWMNKYQGKYYLQYACPGAEYNVYADGVYVSDSPLGPFALAENNPYSYHPGGFMPGAGHGSTMWDMKNNLWHTSTMRISVNHQFERRVGIWRAGFDADGELFCNQRYGDWPIRVDEGKLDPWSAPEWYLLSYGKEISASSFCEGREPRYAVDENVRTWWRAAGESGGEWLCLDLGRESDVRAVQINFADDKIDIPVPGEIRGTDTQPRYIEEAEHVTRWKLEGSTDGKTYFILADKSEVKTDLPHDFVVWENGVSVRWLRLTIYEIPYGQKPCISGFRVFGIGNGDAPGVPEFTAERSEDQLDFNMEIWGSKAIGYNILWGHRADKLYHSYEVYWRTEDIRQEASEKLKKRIGALVKEQQYYVRVDAFNENGITEGMVKKL